MHTLKVDATATQLAAVAMQATDDTPQAIFLTMLSQAAMTVPSAIHSAGFSQPLFLFSPVTTFDVVKNSAKQQFSDFAHRSNFKRLETSRLWANTLRHLKNLAPIPQFLRVRGVD